MAYLINYKNLFCSVRSHSQLQDDDEIILAGSEHDIFSFYAKYITQLDDDPTKKREIQKLFSEYTDKEI